MPSVAVRAQSPLSPHEILAAARDFSARRAELWPDVHLEYLTVHEMGENHAVVTEGNPWPIGYVWERLRYDWSRADALRARVLDSNIFRPGSTWELWVTPRGRSTEVEVRATRHLRGKGWLIAPFFLPWMPGSAASSVHAHLVHFLDTAQRMRDEA